MIFKLEKGFFSFEFKDLLLKNEVKKGELLLLVNRVVVWYIIEKKCFVDVVILVFWYVRVVRVFGWDYINGYFTYFRNVLVILGIFWSGFFVIGCFWRGYFS